MQSIRRFFKVLLNLSMGTCGRRFSSHIFHFFSEIEIKNCQCFAW